MRRDAKGKERATMNNRTIQNSRALTLILIALAAAVAAMGCSLLNPVDIVNW